MQRVRVTVGFDSVAVPETYERVAASDDIEVHVLNWNVAAAPAGFLLRVRGDCDRFEELVRADPDVTDYELFPETATTCHCFLEGEGSPGARAMFENFSRGSLMTVPPAHWNDDGTVTFTIFGTREDIQAAVEGAPSGVSVEVDAVGGTRVAPEMVLQRLSDRQREAVETAGALGYYAVPRDATSEDVAHELDCSPSTAATHLRKAEAKLLPALLNPTQ